MARESREAEGVGSTDADGMVASDTRQRDHKVREDDAESEYEYESLSVRLVALVCVCGVYAQVGGLRSRGRAWGRIEVCAVGPSQSLICTVATRQSRVTYLTHRPVNTSRRPSLQTKQPCSTLRSCQTIPSDFLRPSSHAFQVSMSPEHRVLVELDVR